MAKGIPKFITAFYWQLRGKLYKPSQRAKKPIVIAAAYIWRRLLFRTTFIAITGSTGKTTTKEFLANILEKKYSVMRTPGNWNHRTFLGPEMTILKARPWHRFVVMELGIEVPGDMASVARFVKPHIALMLDIKLCHTNVFKTLEAIAAEKSQLLHYVQESGAVILNQDNAYIAEMPIKKGVEVLRFGESPSADLHVTRLESRWPERLSLDFEYDGQTYPVATRLVGNHWKPTVMAAIAAALYCGVAMPRILQAVEQIDVFWARLQPVVLPGFGGATVLRDDWNGSIDTFEPALKVLADAKANRKIAVFSDYSDSRKKRRRRANHLGRVAAEHVDIAIFVGDYADFSKNAAVGAGLSEEKAHAFFTVAEATAFLKTLLQSGDLVLIKGQANHHLSRIYLGLLGNVKCTLPSCSRQILCDRCPQLGFSWHPEFKPYMAPPESQV
jgi:UDP-N-acetylmuramoyl-tripeptide--D-alanyl-D-alanine ligase